MVFYGQVYRVMSLSGFVGEGGGGWRVALACGTCGSFANCRRACAKNWWEFYSDKLLVSEFCRNTLLQT